MDRDRTLFGCDAGSALQLQTNAEICKPVIVILFERFNIRPFVNISEISNTVTISIIVYDPHLLESCSECG